MNPARSLLLAASQNAWLRDHAAKHKFVRRTVSRFMPGEELSDALAAARRLEEKHIGSIFTHLGENIRDAAEAEASRNTTLRRCAAFANKSSTPKYPSSPRSSAWICLPSFATTI